MDGDTPLTGTPVAPPQRPAVDHSGDTQPNLKAVGPAGDPALDPALAPAEVPAASPPGRGRRARLATAALLLVASVLIWVVGGGGREEAPGAWHENAAAGFTLRVPDGWQFRADDPDGTVLAPSAAADLGLRSIVVTARYAGARTAAQELSMLKARPPAGPVKQIEWLRDEHVTLEGGAEGTMAEFTQVYRGLQLHGWVVIAVHEAQLVQAVAVLPESEAEAAVFEMVGALRSLRPL